MIGRLLRARALHFLLLGAAVVAVERRAPDVVPRPAVTIDAADVALLREQWIDAHGTAPGRDAERTLVATAAEDEILHRDALALGIDRTDAAARRRLARLSEFLGEEALDGDDALARSARSLGLARGDLVVRRHLVEMMRLAASQVGPEDLPTDAELAAWLAGHPERFAQPARVRLRHVYLSRERRGPTLDADAARVRGRLVREAIDPDVAAALGDAFIHGAAVGPASAADLDRLFGADVARAVADAPSATWLGPLRSSYGVHFVWIDERLPTIVPSLDRVRAQVLHALLAERRATRQTARLAALRARWDVRVETP